MGFKERLRAARKAKGLSGEALGKAISDRLGYEAPVSKATISHWEKGRYEPNIEQLACLCALLGVSADHLLLDADQTGLDSTLQDFIREYKNMNPETKAVWKQILSKPPQAPPQPTQPQGKYLTNAEADERQDSTQDKRRFQ